MTTPTELADISAAIHDEYFDIEGLEHDPDRAELRLAIYPGRLKKWWAVETARPPADPPPPPMGTLVVRNVVDVSVNDQADIGWYDVGCLEYEAESGELRSSRTCLVRSSSVVWSWTSSWSVGSPIP